MCLLALFLAGFAAADLPSGRESIPANAEPGPESDRATGNWGGLRDRLAERGVEIGADYAAEVLGSVSGGLRRGAIAAGLLETSVELQTARLGWWPGGMFRVSSLYPHGASLSGKYTGDLLTLSNIDAYDSVRLYELWYEHRLFAETLSIRAGQMLADAEFTYTDAGGDFLNSAFGWPAFVSANVRNTGPAFFVAGTGLRVRYDPAEAWYVQAGIYDGDTFDSAGGDPRPNAGGTHVHWSREQGVFAMAEAGWKLDGRHGALPGAYKIGAWIHTADFPSPDRDENGGEIARTGLPPHAHSSNFGVYAAAEQMIWREQEEQGISLFARAGFAPRDRSLFEFVADFGLSWTGLVPARDHDRFGLGLAHGRVSRDLVRHERLEAEFGNRPASAVSDGETALEAFYCIELCAWWTLQPDFQWIIHPGGSGAIPDALVAGLRTTLVF